MAMNVLYSDPVQAFLDASPFTADMLAAPYDSSQDTPDNPYYYEHFARTSTIQMVWRMLAHRAGIPESNTAKNVFEYGPGRISCYASDGHATGDVEIFAANQRKHTFLIAFLWGYVYNYFDHILHEFEGEHHVLRKCDNLEGETLEKYAADFVTVHEAVATYLGDTRAQRLPNLRNAVYTVARNIATYLADKGAVVARLPHEGQYFNNIREELQATYATYPNDFFGPFYDETE